MFLIFVNGFLRKKCARETRQISGRWRCALKTDCRSRAAIPSDGELSSPVAAVRGVQEVTGAHSSLRFYFCPADRSPKCGFDDGIFGGVGFWRCFCGYGQKRRLDPQQLLLRRLLEIFWKGWRSRASQDALTVPAQVDPLHICISHLDDLFGSALTLPDISGCGERTVFALSAAVRRPTGWGLDSLSVGQSFNRCTSTVRSHGCQQFDWSRAPSEFPTALG
jgi:hypothetical protein